MATTHTDTTVHKDGTVSGGVTGSNRPPAWSDRDGLTSTYPCKGCGAELKFQPGTKELVCPYCATRQEITSGDPHEVRERDFESMLADLAAGRKGSESGVLDMVVVHCDGCQAETQLQPNVTSQACPFCGTPIVATAKSIKLIKPNAIIPFVVTAKQAEESFARWLKGLWFAPSNLSKFAHVDASASDLRSRMGSGGSALAGMYLPFWTYDANTSTDYEGMRGDDYWETEWVTVMVNGSPQRQARQVRKTRWTHVSGHVSNFHNDVLVLASHSVNPDKMRKLGGYDLNALRVYDDGFLSGFRSESYAVDLPEGFQQAKVEMQRQIEASICRDIGGDHQRITHAQSDYSDIMFKHVLLPVWVSAYRYGSRTFQFMVNGQSGAVVGERPYSAWKIAFLVIAILIAIGTIVAIGALKGGSH